LNTLQGDIKLNEHEIKKFSDDNLTSSLGSLFDQERISDQLILIHLIEMEDRKVYAKRGFENLYQMLVRYYKQSEGAANRRLQAMRLLRDVPAAQESLLSGEVNLTTLSMTQIQIRHEERLSGQKISIDRKVEIVNSIKNKTQRETEVELFKLLPETSTKPRNQERRISEHETRLSHNFPDHVLNKLKRLREIWSHVDPNMDYVEIINRCASETLKRVDPLLKKSTRRLAGPRLNSVSHSKTKMADERETPVGQSTASELQPKWPTTSKSRHKRPAYYPIEIKNKVFAKAESCCEYVDRIHRSKELGGRPLRRGLRCRSKFFLQIDHVIPLWAGGTNDLGNLQLLCATHNQLKYLVETNKTSLSDQVKVYRYC
jgi:hypothetical protein